MTRSAQDWTRGGRTKPELILLLKERLQEYRSLSPQEQWDRDRERFLTTEETHGLLDHFLTFGRFADEPRIDPVRSNTHQRKAILQ